MKAHQMELTCFQNPQNLLWEAFDNKNLDAFAAALQFSDPEAEDPKGHLSIFEKICKTKESGDFIELCIRNRGVNVNAINSHFHKAPINYVAETKNYSNLRGLLCQPGVNVDRPVNEMTPLFKLVQSVNDDNAEEIRNCIKLLIKYGANVNTGNQQNITPVLALLRKARDGAVKKPLSILQLFLDHPRIDLDTARGGEARQLLTELFPEIEAPGPVSGPLTYEQLRKWLASEMPESSIIEMIRSPEGKDIIQANQPQADNKLLITATENGRCGAVKALVDLGADANYGDGKCPVKVACRHGEWSVLKQLLKCEKIKLDFNKDDPLLVIIVKRLGDKGFVDRCDYKKCFDALIEDERINVNEVDRTGSTALHYAVKYKNEWAIKSLLQKNAYIGLQNRFKDIPLRDIDSNILRKHFDECISENDLRPGDPKYEIHFDYSNMTPSGKDGKPLYVEEMNPITYMAKNPELKQLLKHPLISSFLFLKWHRLQWLFYANLLFYSIFSISLIIYLVVCYGHEVSAELSTGLWCISALGGCYVLVREVFQFITAPTVYFKSMENYLEIVLLGLTGVVLVNAAMEEELRRFVASILILLISFEFAVLVGALPLLSFSTHMVMLKTVFQSLMKSLAFYSIIIISFALCFYTLLGGGRSDAAGEASTNGSQPEDFNKFINPQMAILKTIVMMTGEFEAANIEFLFPINYSIFLVFVIFISIVLFNLLNGLAVSDTQQIKDEAELVGLIGRADLLARFEKIIMKDSNHWNRLVLQNCFFERLLKRRICLFPDYLPASKIVLLPNMNNKLVVMPGKPKAAGELKKDGRSPSAENLVDRIDDIEMGPSIMCCLSMERCSPMDGGIAKQAQCVIGRKRSEKEVEEEKKSFDNRIKLMESKLDQILAGLNNINRNSVNSQ